MSEKIITNKGHPVTDGLADQWHKVLGAVMLKLGVETVKLSVADISALEGFNIVARDGVDGDGLLHIIICSDKEALKYLERSKN